MKEDSPKNPPSMNLALWLTVVAIVMGVVIPSIYEEPKTALIAATEPEIGRPEISDPLQDKPPPSKLDKPLPIMGWNSAERHFQPMVMKAANRHKVDPAMVMAIIMAESSYNPKAISKKGAKGLMQLMPTTARSLGVKDSFNPEHNINAGVRYYKKLLNQFDGDVKLALAAYNAGSRKVREHRGIPPYGATKFYVKKVIKYYKYYKTLIDNSRLYS
ncbi:MAG: lytic transglycosylase domain-containing protein [Deltaproteobacteria bacterium]|nr:lytic transglycosylase domain-containing protein [Deltaproteobacteria bacterium]MBT8357031.1 lytic transglycosylase domain-containing protein [Deltaproteobacteria bacterium]NNK85142.1 lytic transglycosylase domain-containing protein [Desulfobacterales bacterium]NNL42983.1 lytic transglycosylase domain-containing protein [Desulfobacterales bacterium]